MRMRIVIEDVEAHEDLAAAALVLRQAARRIERNDYTEPDSFRLYDPKHDDVIGECIATTKGGS